MMQATERHLILVKHAEPEINPERAASAWTLSDAGRASCRPLADALAPYDPAVIIASTEPKARETADLLGMQLKTPVEVVNSLHEHDRTGVPFLAAVADWDMAMAQFFAKPDHLVLGRETAFAAQLRFTTAIGHVLESYTVGNIAVIAHGTVISLFVALHVDIEPMSLWRRLGLPSFVVLRLPMFSIEEIAETIPRNAPDLSPSGS
jgi:broad specificity phosphatase PhoE